MQLNLNSEIRDWERYSEQIIWIESIEWWNEELNRIIENIDRSIVWIIESI